MFFIGTLGSLGRVWHVGFRGCIGLLLNGIGVAFRNAALGFAWAGSGPSL